MLRGGGLKTFWWEGWWDFRDDFVFANVGNRGGSCCGNGVCMFVDVFDFEVSEEWSGEWGESFGCRCKRGCGISTFEVTSTNHFDNGDDEGYSGVRVGRIFGEEVTNDGLFIVC